MDKAKEGAPERCVYMTVSSDQVGDVCDKIRALMDRALIEKGSFDEFRIDGSVSGKYHEGHTTLTFTFVTVGKD